MKIGKFDQKIEFFTEGQVSDGYGGTTPGDITVLKTFAAIEQLPQSRNIEQVQLSLPSTYRVSVMYRSGFTPSVKMMVKWRNEKFNIITSPVIDEVRITKQWTFDICRS